MDPYLFDVTDLEWNDIAEEQRDNVVTCDDCGDEMVLDENSALSMGYHYCSEETQRQISMFDK